VLDAAALDDSSSELPDLAGAPHLRNLRPRHLYSAGCPCCPGAAPFLPVRLRRSSLCQTNDRWLLGDQPHELPSFSFGSKGKTNTKTKEKEKSKLGSLFFFILFILLLLFNLEY